MPAAAAYIAGQAFLLPMIVFQEDNHCIICGQFLQLFISYNALDQFINRLVHFWSSNKHVQKLL
jgi:hypothetical protein